MRNYVMGLLVSACVLSRSAFAIGFCDDPQRQLSPIGGGECHQTRATIMADGVVSPSYSDLDMTAYWSGPAGPISFTLDTGRLYLGAALTDEQRVEVLEFGLGQFSQLGSQTGNVSGEHVLTITVDRLPSGSWSLGYTWLAAPANWSIVSATSMPSVEAGGETALFAPNVTSVVVDIVPLGGWQQLVVSARPSGRLQGETPASSTFDMPPAPTAAHNRPVRLRTGVLGGDLRAAIQTKYLFTAPFITYGQ